MSILLSFLLLLSSSGLAYSQHFCGGMEITSSITLGEKSLSCRMEVPASACDLPTNSDGDCCDDEHTAVKTDDSFSKVSFHITFQKPFSAVTPATYFSTRSLATAALPNHWAFYSPPPIQKNLPVLYQVFLI